jgi:HPt (histidine-containing phosphotransfer) domain-containing protein
LVHDIRRAIAEDDAQRLQRAAHTLKGSLAYLSAQTCYDMALEMELIGRTGELASARPLFVRLARQMERLAPELTAYVEQAQLQSGTVPTAGTR